MLKHFAKRLDFKIPENLKQFLVAVIHGQSESDLQLTYPVFATGFPLLIDVYGDMPILHINQSTHHPKSRLNIAGQITETDIDVEINGNFDNIGFVLYPTALYYLFHKRGNFFLNRWRSMEDIQRIDSNILLSDLSSCGDLITRLDLMLELIQNLTKERLSCQGWLDRTMNIILKQDGLVSQQELASIAGLSLRHFRRRFKEIIGVSPKYYCKVIQINTFFELFNSSNNIRLNALALDCGYYDHAHFTNDFKNFIGMCPRDFLNSEHEFVRTYLGRRSF